MTQPEDKQTNTVSGAAAYERMRALRDDPDPLDYYGEGEEEDEDEDEEEYDRCGCSDPTCPCEGRKIGLP